LLLYDNQLKGSIPSEIGNLTNLTALDLCNNQLTGSIPSEIGNLTNLSKLKLEYNQLKGEIPESICNLNVNWSKSFDFGIYNNQLSPPYPSCIEDYVGEEDVVSEPRMTRAGRREAADDFWKSLGSSLEAKIASGFTEKLAILQAEMIQKEMKKPPE